MIKFIRELGKMFMISKRTIEHYDQVLARLNTEALEAIDSFVEDGSNLVERKL